MRRLLAASLLLSGTFFAAPPALAEGVHLTRQQFQLYRDYQDALKDDRVQKLKPNQRLPAIAKNFHVKPQELEQAIALGDKEADQVQGDAEAALNGAFGGTPLEGKVAEVKVDARSGHVVASIVWVNGEPAKLDQEACWAAERALHAAPLVGTIALQANDATAKKQKVFSALIGADRASNIHEDRIVDFASTRYVRLFEKREVVVVP
jgi:hypothetical protein